MKTILRPPRIRAARVPGGGGSSAVGGDPHNLFPNAPEYTDSGSIIITVPDQPTIDAETVEYRVAFGENKDQVLTNLDTDPVRNLVLEYGGFSDTMKTVEEGFIGIRLTARDSAGSHLSRVTLVYGAPAGYSGNADLQWTFGYEGKLIKSVSGSKVYFVWHPDVTGGEPGKSEISTAAVGSRLWGNSPEIIELDDEWIQTFPSAGTDILPDSRLILDAAEPQQTYLLNLKLDGAATVATKHWVTGYASSVWCGFNGSSAESSEDVPPPLDWPSIPVGGDIDYSADTLS